MAGVDNLKPVRNKAEARELGKKGGVASGKARREKATMKKTLEMMLEEIPKSKNPEGLTYKQLATLGLIKGAVIGNNANYKTILETIGEIQAEATKETPDININIIDNSALEKALYEEEEEK